MQQLFGVMFLILVMLTSVGYSDDSVSVPKILEMHLANFQSASTLHMVGTEQRDKKGTTFPDSQALQETANRIKRSAPFVSDEEALRGARVSAEMDTSAQTFTRDIEITRKGQIWKTVRTNAKASYIPPNSTNPLPLKVPPTS